MGIKKSDLIELLAEARVNLPDQKALKFKAMYPIWKADLDVEVGQRYQYEDKLYKCKTAHTTADHWKPSIDTASLWEVIDEQHEGTLEDPIPYDTNMTVYKDKYYIYNDVVYLCIRDSGQPLYSEPAPLVGNYFEVA